VIRLLSTRSSRSRAADPSADFLTPIVADGDTGHGGLTAVMKLTKMFIEAGAAGIHFEDQAPGTKKYTPLGCPTRATHMQLVPRYPTLPAPHGCIYVLMAAAVLLGVCRCGHMGGKVLVPAQEHIDRLVAARLQADIMGTSTLIVARTDAEAATYITSNIDARDHPFILGASRPTDGTLNEALQTARDRGKSVESVEAAWLSDAKLQTFPKLVACHPLAQCTRPRCMCA
jgi:isocitrate lyase